MTSRAEAVAPVWISSPQKKHYDTNMSPGIVTTVDGMKLLIVDYADTVRGLLARGPTGASGWSGHGTA